MRIVGGIVRTLVVDKSPANDPNADPMMKYRINAPIDVA